MKKNNNKIHKKIEKLTVSANLSQSKNSIQSLSKIDNPLIKPVEILLRDGKPPGITYTIFIEYKNVNYFFGSIIYTKGKQIVYYPGLKNVWIEDYEKGISGFMDHITCNKNLTKSHAKFKDKSKKSSNLHIIELYENYYHWFTIAFNKLDNLEKLEDETINISIPIKDSERRINELIEAYKNGALLPINLNSFDITDKDFVKFDFYFTKKDNLKALDIRIQSLIAKPTKNNTTRTIVLPIIFKNQDYTLLIITSILEKKSEEELNDKRARFFYRVRI